MSISYNWSTAFTVMEKRLIQFVFSSHLVDSLYTAGRWIISESGFGVYSWYGVWCSATATEIQAVHAYITGQTIHISNMSSIGVLALCRYLSSRYKTAKSAIRSAESCCQALWFWECKSFATEWTKRVVYLLSVLPCTRAYIWSYRLHNRNR